MTDETFRPIIHGQADLEDVWRSLMEPLGFSRRSLWLMFIDTDDRPMPQMTEIEDLPVVLGDEELLGLQSLLAHFRDTGLRPAFLLSRPGSRRPDRRGPSLCRAGPRRLSVRRRRGGGDARGDRHRPGSRPDGRAPAPGERLTSTLGSHDQADVPAVGRRPALCGTRVARSPGRAPAYAGCR